MKKTKSTTAWGNSVNLNLGGGLYSETPLRLYKDNEFPKDYWDKRGDWGASLGSSGDHGHIAFVSLSKKEVELWTEGVKAFRIIIRGIVGK
jgi:hypothetical protein